MITQRFEQQADPNWVYCPPFLPNEVFSFIAIAKSDYWWDTLRTYAEILKNAIYTSTDKSNPSRQAWYEVRGILNNTKLFEVPSNIVQQLVEHAPDDIYDLLMVDPKLPSQAKQEILKKEILWPGKEDQKQAASGVLQEYYQYASLPDNLPFDNFTMFFLDGIDQHLIGFPVDAQDKVFIQSRTLIAITIAYNKVYAFSLDKEIDRISLSTIYNGKEWFADTPDTAARIKLVLDSINIINSYRKYVHEREHGLKHKMNVQKAIKAAQFKFVPPPYYRVQLQDALVQRQYADRSIAKQEASHRYDVRGHERVRFQRGLKPMPESMRLDLSKRGYQIFESQNPPERIVHLLSLRYIPNKRPDEWLAVLVSWVDAYIKGPENAPYVPALRVLT